MSRRLGLREPLDGRERDGRSIRLPKALDYCGERRSQLRLGRGHVGVGGPGLDIVIEGVRSSISPETRRRVAHGIPRDLEQPGFRPIRAPERRKVPHDAQEHVLQQIVRLDPRRHAPREKRAQRWRQLAQSATGSIAPAGGTGMASIPELFDIATPPTLIPSRLFYVKTPVLADGRKSKRPARGGRRSTLAPDVLRRALPEQRREKCLLPAGRGRRAPLIVRRSPRRRRSDWRARRHHRRDGRLRLRIGPRQEARDVGLDELSVRSLRVFRGPRPPSGARAIRRSRDVAMARTCGIGASPASVISAIDEGARRRPGSPRRRRRSPVDPRRSRSSGDPRRRRTTAASGRRRPARRGARRGPDRAPR